MAQGIGEVLTFAIGVAISPVPIIAVILMLFSGRAKVNGPMFLAGWVVALAAVSGIAYVISDAGNVSTDSAAANGVSWAQIVFGVLFLLLAWRSWRNRPAPGTEPQMPKWMAAIDAFTPSPTESPRRSVLTQAACVPTTACQNSGKRLPDTPPNNR